MADYNFKSAFANEFFANESTKVALDKDLEQALNKVDQSFARLPKIQERPEPGILGDTLEGAILDFYQDQNNPLPGVLAALDDFLPGIPGIDIIPDPPPVETMGEMGGNVRTGINKIDVALAILSLPSLAKQALKRGGRVATNVITPYTYSNKLVDLYRAFKPGQRKQSIRNIKKDQAILSGPREHPYREAFGLKAREGWDRIYKINPDNTVNIRSLWELDKMAIENVITKHQYRVGVQNLSDLYETIKPGRFQTGKARGHGVFGGFKRKVTRDKIYFKDDWDFVANPGDTTIPDIIKQVVLKGKLSDFQKSQVAPTLLRSLLTRTQQVGGVTPMKFRGAVSIKESKKANDMLVGTSRDVYERYDYLQTLKVQ